MKQSICPLSGLCGGCSYQGIPYSEQLKMKQDKAARLLSCFHDVDPIIGMDDPYHYRNKIQIACGYDHDHRPASGFYMSGSHIIVPFNECLIAENGLNSLMSSLLRIIRSLRIPFYDERSGKGCLRHILLRTTNTGEYMAVFVTGRSFLPEKEELVRRIIHYDPQVRTIVHNINTDRRTSSVLGKRNILLYGDGYITDRLCGMDFKISASSFYQANLRQTEVLYREAIRLAGLKKDETLLDAYCGTGTIGLYASRYVRQVIGVEINKAAIAAAIRNAADNDIATVSFVCDDAGHYLKRLAGENKKIDVLIMDPPRSGSDKAFLDSLIRLGPTKAVYISCEPGSLASDLQYLKGHYDVEKILPVDMFPFTPNIETIVQLRKKRTDKGDL